MLRAGGPVPRHVAIVMDGNRRFAASRNLRRERGHEFGAEKLLDVLEWCLALGVRCLSVYAFSTDNFKRSEAEIATLMDLAERRLDELAESDAIEPDAFASRSWAKSTPSLPGCDAPPPA